MIGFCGVPGHDLAALQMYSAPKPGAARSGPDHGAGLDSEHGVRGDAYPVSRYCCRPSLDLASDRPEISGSGLRRSDSRQPASNDTKASS
jgi:hypothetical protein